ncbi:MAG: PhoH family protein [Clostridium sp.]|nr:PhoH family protein [Clostridium sp.]
MQDLFGIGDNNLKALEHELAIQVITRDGAVEVQGETEEQVAMAAEVLRTLDRMRQVGEPMNEFAVTRAMQFVREGDPEAAVAAMKDIIAYTFTGAPIKCRTLGQRKYVKAMEKGTVTIAIGPAGTGKTYLAVASAVAALKRKEITKIVMCRPAVEAGEKLGFLPGDLQTKVDPYLRPLYDALDELLGPETVARYMENRTIEIAPLAYMRGRTLKNCRLIADECQNMSLSQHLMILTRLGEGSQMVLTGDVTQIDLPDPEDSGLEACANILDGMEDISVIRLSGSDVVRHKLVGEIVKAFEQHNAKKKEQPGKNNQFRNNGKKFYRR